MFTTIADVLDMLDQQIHLETAFEPEVFYHGQWIPFYRLWRDDSVIIALVSRAGAIHPQLSDSVYLKIVTDGRTF